MKADTKKELIIIFQSIACIILAAIFIVSLFIFMFNYYGDSRSYNGVILNKKYGSVTYTQTSPDNHYTVEIYDDSIYCFDNFNETETNDIYCTLDLSCVDYNDDIQILWNKNEMVMIFNYNVRVGFHHSKNEYYKLTIPYSDFV